MWLQQLSLTDIRSYAQADIHLTPGVTCFIGSNGQGKTNIVEMVGTSPLYVVIAWRRIHPWCAKDVISESCAPTSWRVIDT